MTTESTVHASDSAASAKKAPYAAPCIVLIGDTTMTEASKSIYTGAEGAIKTILITDFTLSPS